MRHPPVAILHYTAPPVIGGVEAVIHAHARIFSEAGYPASIVAGRGEAQALPDQVNLVQIPEMDSGHPAITRQSAALEKGSVPEDFNALVGHLYRALRSSLDNTETVVLHNLFTKHFNLPLTAALYRLLDEGSPKNWIAWCHDFTWTSPHSRDKVHPGYPWDLIRSYHPKVVYVTVSRKRQQELAGLFGCPVEEIQVIYNGIDPETLLGFSPAGYRLVQRLGLLQRDLNVLMPVRITQAKNIEFALRVAAALKASGADTQFILTGPVDPHDQHSMGYFRKLKTMSQALGVEDVFHFIFDSGPDPLEPYFIDERVVGDLYRACDILFMPSHREGFGMPVLEAGLAGMQVFSSAIPAAIEIGEEDIIRFDPQEGEEQVAARLLNWAAGDHRHRLRRKVRQDFTWEAIFRKRIEPLLQAEGASHAV